MICLSSAGFLAGDIVEFLSRLGQFQPRLTLETHEQTASVSGCPVHDDLCPNGESAVSQTMSPTRPLPPEGDERTAMHSDGH